MAQREPASNDCNLAALKWQARGVAFVCAICLSRSQARTSITITRPNVQKLYSDNDGAAGRRHLFLVATIYCG